MTDYIVEMSYEDTKECFDTLSSTKVIDYGALTSAFPTRKDAEYNKADIGILQYKLKKYGAEEHFNNPRRLNQQFIEEQMYTENEVIAQILFEETQLESTATFLALKWGFHLRAGETVNEGLTTDEN